MSEQNTNSAQSPPGKEVDHKYPFPTAYYSFNPQLFDDENWKLRDLQKLCKTLAVQVQDYDERASPDSKAKIRQIYVSELQRWHKTPIRQSNARHIRRKGTTNFALLQVEVPDETASTEAKHDPKLLTPLKNKPRRLQDGSPVSILRAKCSKNDMRTVRSPARQMSIKEGKLFSPSDPRHQKRNIKMSIFNGTKIIPPKPAIFDDWLNEAGVTYEDTESESDAFMSPTKEQINRFYEQHTPQISQQQQQQYQQQQQPTTPIMGPQQQQQQQLKKSIGFSSPASSINSDAGSTPLKSAKMRQPTPAIKKCDQIIDDDDDDEFSLPEEFEGDLDVNTAVSTTDSTTHDEYCGLSPTPEETDDQMAQLAMQQRYEEEMLLKQQQQRQQQLLLQQQQQQLSGPMTRRRSIALQQQQQQPLQMQQQQQQHQRIVSPPTTPPPSSQQQRTKPLTRVSVARSQQNNMMQQQQPQTQDKMQPNNDHMAQVTRNRISQQQSQRRPTDPIDQELVDGMNALSF